MMDFLCYVVFGDEKWQGTSLIGAVIVGILLLAVLILLLWLVKRIVTTFLGSIELSYALLYKRPIFVHLYFKKRELAIHHTKILEHKFSFYTTLTPRHKTYFRHRMATFLKQKEFEAKEGFVITDDAKILIAATAVMLTFGFRAYKLESVKRIVIYPTVYYSPFSKTTNKGEYNARLKTLVLSWDNFLEGYAIEDDKINLGIHEFAHAIHYSSMKRFDINSVLFVDEFNALRRILATDTALKDRLVNSTFIRSYAFTNDSELLAVIIETFIEAPLAFKEKFPEIYTKVKDMLNFNFKGYR